MVRTRFSERIFSNPLIQERFKEHMPYRVKGYTAELKRNGNVCFHLRKKLQCIIPQH